MTLIGDLADPEVGCLKGLVDLEQYPIGNPGSPEWVELVSSVRERLSATGCVTLKDFLTPEALEAIANELAATSCFVPIRRQRSTVYARTDLEANCDAGDPRVFPLEWFTGHVTRDMIPPYSPAHRLYVSGLFKQFVAAAVGEERVFEYADPLAGLVATILPPGGQYPWHYDTNEYVLTIMTQRPDAGGQFQYSKDLRSPGDENLDGLAGILGETDLSSVQTASFGPGDLQLFKGRYSLHRVTRVEGQTDRHVLVLSYGDRPGVIGPADRTRSVYGRVTEAHLLADQARLAAADGLIL